MTEADILALTYEDTVTVYRPFKDRLPNGETAFHRKAAGRKVYESISCALSTHTGGTLNRELPAGSVPTQYSLFVRPEIEIEPNDYLEIKQRGRLTKAMAGLAERQPSHNQVPLVMEQERV